MKKTSKKFVGLIAMSMFALIACGQPSSTPISSNPTTDSGTSTPSGSTSTPTSTSSSTAPTSTSSASSAASSTSSEAGTSSSSAATTEEAGIRMNYNYDGCPDPIVKTVNKKRVKLISLFDETGTGDVSAAYRNIPVPERPGYRFVGWFDSQTPASLKLEKTFDFTKNLPGITDVYAQWEAFDGTSHETVIECEHTPELISKASQGLGYSGGTTEWMSFIIADTTGTASNEAFLSYLYANGFSLDFRFYSDKATTGSLKMRYSNEFVNLELDQTTYPIKFNNEVINYTLNRPHTGQPNDIMPFVDIELGSINITKGWNVINCTSANMMAAGNGTMQAAAPLLDCFKITSDAAISYISTAQ